MTWLVWRQNRFQTMVMAGCVAVLGVVVLATGMRMGTVLQARPYDAVITLLRITVALPLVLGVFFGAAGIARETEAGTHVLAWTQSSTRRRWVVTKLASAVLITLAIQSVVAGLATWWFGPFEQAGISRFQPLQFDIAGVAPVGHALFATALGLVAGALFRRVLPAIGTTVGGYFVVRFFIELWARSRFLAAETVFEPLGPQVQPSGDWTVSTGLVGPDGRNLDFLGPGTACPQAVDRASMDACLHDLGYRIKRVFHPASDYWPLQLIETGVFVAIAVVLLAAAYFLLTRRDA